MAHFHPVCRQFHHNDGPHITEVKQPEVGNFEQYIKNKCVSCKNAYYPLVYGKSWRLNKLKNVKRNWN